MRRLAWVGVGCQLASVELWVTPSELSPHFEQEDPHAVTMCDAAEYYLAVFDVPTDLIPPDADLAGSIVG